MIHPRCTTRHGFTVLELMVALALSSLVVLSAIGITGMISSSDRVTKNYMNDTANLSQTQFVVRRALQNLVAAKPLPPPGEDDPNAELDADGDFGGEEDLPEADSGSDSILDSLFGGLDDGLPIELAIADTSKPPNFELYYERVIYPPTGQEISLPRFEIVTSIWPVPRKEIPISQIDDPRQKREELAAKIRGTIRGVFELLYLEDGFALVYTPIEPPGDPYILGRRFVDLMWEVLPKDAGADGWQTVHACYLEDEYPSAVRLRLRTDTGATADWLFETIVLTEGQ
ncbi:MAG: type II secretion system protein J [Phycisphaerales bacterium JB065]